ncbi:MAG: LysR family transcriptional regulator [Proteobacteria bacterium]|nr:LysR family transcriptional regulator [Pseudomonadota bacterium]
MDFRQISAFQAVMIAGTTTLAAERLNISQPAVSRLLIELERSIQLKLFIRKKGGRLQPTPEAEIFFKEVEHSLSGLEKLKQAALDIRNFGTGRIRIACLPALAMGFLPKVIKKFRLEYPNVSVSLQTRSSSTIRHWAGRQQVDFGLATPEGSVPGVQGELFARTPGVCVMPKGHPLAQKKTIEPNDLEGLPFISLALEDKSRFRIDQVFEKASVKRQMLIETQYSATICGLILEGLGVSIMSRFTVHDFEDRGITARPFSPPIHFEYMIYVPRHRPMSALTKTFIRIMKEYRDQFLT